MKIKLDTAKGGYTCWHCHLPLLPNEEQIILGQYKSFSALCSVCIARDNVQIGYTKLGISPADDQYSPADDQ